LRGFSSKQTALCSTDENNPFRNWRDQLPKLGALPEDRKRQFYGVSQATKQPYAQLTKRTHLGIEEISFQNSVLCLKIINDHCHGTMRICKHIANCCRVSTFHFYDSCILLCKCKCVANRHDHCKYDECRFLGCGEVWHEAVNSFGDVCTLHCEWDIAICCNLDAYVLDVIYLVAFHAMSLY
jgi:hypothetical protein